MMKGAPVIFIGLALVLGALLMVGLSISFGTTDWSWLSNSYLYYLGYFLMFAIALSVLALYLSRRH